jgi:hypothetical protein
MPRAGRREARGLCSAPAILNSGRPRWATADARLVASKPICFMKIN